jgi:hypothetical protein
MRRRTPGPSAAWRREDNVIIVSNIPDVDGKKTNHHTYPVREVKCAYEYGA